MQPTVNNTVLRSDVSQPLRPHQSDVNSPKHILENKESLALPSRCHPGSEMECRRPKYPSTHLPWFSGPRPLPRSSHTQNPSRCMTLRNLWDFLHPMRIQLPRLTCSDEHKPVGKGTTFTILCAAMLWYAGYVLCRNNGPYEYVGKL